MGMGQCLRIVPGWTGNTESENDQLTVRASQPFSAQIGWKMLCHKFPGKELIISKQSNLYYLKPCRFYIRTFLKMMTIKEGLTASIL